jgi:hypothetical protein
MSEKQGVSRREFWTNYGGGMGRVNPINLSLRALELGQDGPTLALKLNRA